MRSVLVAALLAVSALTGVAHADVDYQGGGCRMQTVDDTLGSGVLGGADTWNGTVQLLVLPTGAHTGAQVSAACEIRVNGATPRTVLEGSGTGIALAAGTLTYTAAVTDVVYLCTRVTVGAETVTRCADIGPATVCPTPVCGNGGLLDQAVAAVDAVDEQRKVLDPAVCAQLVAAATAVDALPAAGVLYVDPATGDTYVGGTAPEDLTWDCPPYAGQ